MIYLRNAGEICNFRGFSRVQVDTPYGKLIFICYSYTYTTLAEQRWDASDMDTPALSKLSLPIFPPKQ